MSVRWTAMLLGVLLGTGVAAQEPPADEGPLPLPAQLGNAPLPAQAPVEPSWSDRCLARPVGYYGGVGPYWHHPAVLVSEGGTPVASAGHGASQAAGSSHAATPVSGPGSGSSGSSGGKGLGEAAALLVVAAVAVAVVLPFIVYGLDEEASDDVVGRADCPQFDLDVRGGIEGDLKAGVSTPLFLRARASDGWFGLQAQFELAPWSVERRLIDGSIAAWLRFTPRQHVEVGITVGYRSQVVRETFRPGAEVAIPHEYVFWRSGARQLGLEFRPAVFIFNGGVDVSLDFALRVPLGDLVSLNLGGRVFTFDALAGIGAAALGGFSARF